MNDQRFALSQARRAWKVIVVLLRYTVIASPGTIGDASHVTLLACLKTAELSEIGNRKHMHMIYGVI
jgi:hypothetical protein